MCPGCVRVKSPIVLDLLGNVCAEISRNGCKKIILLNRHGGSNGTLISELNRYTCRFNYRITRLDPDRPRPTLVVKGYTVHAAVTRDGALTRLPENIQARLQQLADSHTR